MTGSGTLASPYIVTTAAELKTAMETERSTGEYIYIELGNTIDMNYNAFDKITTPASSDHIDLDLKGYAIQNVFWSGLSRYLGDFRGDLTFNIDRPWSLPTFGNVLCHEGYPGHHAFYCHWDDLFRQGKLPLEGSFYIKNTPTNAMFEGGPECALHFLGWDDFEEDTPEISDREKADFALGRDIMDLQRIYQTNCCHLVNIEGMSQDAAIQYMTSTGMFKERLDNPIIEFKGNGRQKLP